MATIPASMARGLFTKMLIDVYRERPVPAAFLRSFFQNVESTTKYVSVEVSRGTEKVAVDVTRGSEGNRNTFSKSTEKVIEPPFYREFFDITELEGYDRLFGTESISESVFASIMEEAAERIRDLVAKIERAYELQCAQVLTTGIVTVANGDNIDFKRKSASLVDNSASPWTTGTVDPYAQLEAGITFLRQTGKAQGGTYNAIVGSVAMNAFLNNATVKARGPLSNINFDTLRAPQRESVGGTTFGVITAGSYKVNLWTYPEYYDNSSGVQTPYIDPKKVIIVPESPRFKMAFGGIAHIDENDNPVVEKGAFVFGKYVDKRKSTVDYDVRSAGVAIPVAVDQIYTTQVVA